MAQYTKEQLDQILKFGCIQKPPRHGFKVGDRCELNRNEAAFLPGRTGEVIGFDDTSTLIRVRLDILPNSDFLFHHSHLEREGSNG